MDLLSIKQLDIQGILAAANAAGVPLSWSRINDPIHDPDCYKILRPDGCDAIDRIFVPLEALKDTYDEGMFLPSHKYFTPEHHGFVYIGSYNEDSIVNLGSNALKHCWRDTEQSYVFRTYQPDRFDYRLVFDILKIKAAGPPVYINETAFQESIIQKLKGKDFSNILARYYTNRYWNEMPIEQRKQYWASLCSSFGLSIESEPSTSFSAEY